MATVVQEFGPRAAILPASNFAQFKSVAGTNFPVESLAFDGGSTDESAYFIFRAARYGSGNVTVRVRWYADTASSGNVVFGAALAAITPNTDTTDIETKAFGTAATTQDAHLGTTNQRLHELTITITSLDSVAADDWCALWLYRDASDTTNDTLTGDALVVEVDIEYSDT